MLVSCINFSARCQNLKQNTCTSNAGKVKYEFPCDNVNFSARNPKIPEPTIDLDAILKNVFGIERVKGPTHTMIFPDGESIEIPIGVKKETTNIPQKFIKFDKGKELEVWISEENGIRTSVINYPKGHPDFLDGGYERTKQDLETGNNSEVVIQVNNKEKITKKFNPEANHLVSVLKENEDINDKSGIKSVLEEYETFNTRVKNRLETRTDGSTTLTEHINGLPVLETVRNAAGQIIKQK
jgi:hypothetical protein